MYVSLVVCVHLFNHSISLKLALSHVDFFNYISAFYAHYTSITCLVSILCDWTVDGYFMKLS